MREPKVVPDQAFRDKRTKKIICVRCGKEKMVTPWKFYNWRFGIDGNRYCSKECFLDDLAICCVCGKSTKERRFDYQHLRSQYCSPECQKIGNDRHARAVGRMTTCAICGNEFPDYYNNAKYCSSECRRIAAERKKKETKKNPPKPKR